MIPTVWDKLSGFPLYDVRLVSHEFTTYLRDYTVVTEQSAADINGDSYIFARYLYCFTHCVYVQISTALTDEIWHKSWPDSFLEFETWRSAGSPEGFAWWVRSSDAYRGFIFKPDSPLAADWTNRLSQPMHELLIETNTHNITLVFNDVHIKKIAKGNPETKELISIDSSSGFVN